MTLDLPVAAKSPLEPNSWETVAVPVASASDPISPKTTPKDVQDDSLRTIQPVEMSVAFALAEAARAGQWDVVALLAKELEARRLAGLPNVVALDLKRPKGGG